MHNCRSLRIFLFSTIILLSVPSVKAQQIDPPFHGYMNHPWVDSVMKTLSVERQIAQCIWIAGYSNSDISHEVEVSDIIRKYGIGGIIFFEGTAEKQAELTNFYQKISEVPLIITLDAEWGVGMRLRNIEKFPFQMTLGAIKNDSLVYELGKAMAMQFKRLGIQMNLAPDTGINTNPDNPVIKYLSFGENRENVANKAVMFMKGMQDNGILAAGKYYKPGEADAKALEAGNDVAEFVSDVEATISETKKYIALKKLSAADIALKCRKVLAVKYWAGLSNPKTVNQVNITKELSPMTSKALIRDLYANALTVLNNNQVIIPVKNLPNSKIATISINRSEASVFQKRIGDYFPADQYFINPSDTAAVNSLLKKLHKYNLVIAGVFNLDQGPNMGFGIKPELNSFLEKLILNNKTIISWFGNPYGTDKIDVLKRADGLVLAYEENDYTEDLSAQLIFGGIGAKGTLPVTINDKWPSGFGINTRGNLRMQYGLPENAGMSSEILNNKIDSIANAGLEANAYPGCVVMAARHGVVVFHKAYGYQTYDKRIPVRIDDLYDLASVTKISSTLAGLMVLNTEGKFSPDQTLGFYLPDFKNTNKGDIGMRDFLTHQAGLTPFISFWKETLKKDGEFKNRTFKSELTKRYPLEVAQGLYINKNYRKKMFNEIKKSKLGEKKYVYSDLTFIIAPQIIERLSGQKWYEFVADSVYKKLGALEMGFNPYKKFPIDRIVPTEYDSTFRKQLLHGTVHDEGAAMLGGISGHAGLFADANDLMKLMELYRRMGEYDGQQIISRNVMLEYTRVQFPENNNRRGLGFDKPILNNATVPQKDTYPTRGASPESFGHSGYTGTFVWVDPVHDISYVFLCNRVNPTRNNNLVSDMNIRTGILQAIYDAIEE